MKNLSKIFNVLMIAFLSVAILSCDDDDDTTPPAATNTIVDFVVNAGPDYSDLLAAVIKADLAETLSGPGPFTVFAPNNDAFDTFLAANGFADLDAVPTDVLTEVLLNHTVSGSLTASGLPIGYINSLATSTAANLPMSMYVEKSSGVVVLNGVSTVTGADNVVDNGVVHLVGDVIGLPSIATHAVANSTFSSLVEALSLVDLVPTVDTGGPFTVLAPTNAAFDTFLNGADLGDIPVPALTQVLLNHVLNGVTLSTDLTTAGAGYSNTLASGADDNVLSIYFNTSDGVTFNGKSTVLVADVIANNGVIHAVDAVITLPTVVDFALADPTFSTLVAALTDARLTTDFVTLLSTPNGTDPAPFTVFAPTNTAFGDLLTELGFDGLEDIGVATLDATLKYHVVTGANVVEAQIMNDMPIGTVGGMITANVDDTVITLTDANGRVSTVVATNVQAANGVIHAIDKVILPNLNPRK